jgi:glucose 1-dehydrogenase
MMELKLEGKTALVTGASRGIGRAIAVEFARQGANVIVNYARHREEADSVANEILGLGRRALAHRADIGDRQAVASMFQTAIAAFHRLDIVVANAASSIRKTLLDLSVEDVEKTWAVSLWGVFHTCQEAARHMAENGGGNIVVVSSVHSFRPYPGASAYNGAKAAVNQMAATWAVELAGYGIRVNVLEPGWTDTPGERAFYSEDDLAAAGATLLLGRLATAEEMARAAVFLASKDSSYMVGGVLRVDGGYSLHH